MPSGDRTGPMGQGPRTGRSLGFCSGYDMPGNLKGFGGGMSRRGGFGRGRGAESLKRSQKDIEKRLSDIEKEGE